MTNDNTKRAIKRRTMLKGAGASTIAAFAGCIGGDSGSSGDDDGGDDGGSSGGGGGKLFFAQVKSPVEFDPIVLNDVPSAQIANLVFEGLYGYGEGTGVEPVIATGEPEIENDGTRFIVPFDTDATFHNGESVTVDDIRHSFMAPVEESTENSGEVNMIQSIEEVDEETVQFDIDPYAAFNTTLARNIVPMDYRQEDPERFNKEAPIGTGPFEFNDWSEGEFVSVTRYDDYWGDLDPALDEIEFQPIEEQTTRVTNLQTGDVDIIETIPPDQYPTVQDMDGAEIMETPGIGYFYAAFNCNEGPTADPTVREAIDYAVNIDQAVEDFLEPAGVRQYSPFPKSISDEWDFPTDEWSQIPHDKDIDQASQLFDEAGISSDYEWRIIVPPDDKRERIGVTIGNGLQEAGFENVSVQRLDWGAFLDQYYTGNEDDYNMYLLGWSGTPDPEAFTYYLFAQEQEGENGNQGTYYRNDDVDEAILEARQITDREQRRELYIDAVTTLLEDRVHLPAYNTLNSFGVRNTVSGYQAHPDGSTLPIAEDYTTVSVE